jgi:hypothetical protein
MQSRRRTAGGGERGRGRVAPSADDGDLLIENRRLRAERKALQCQLRVIRADFADFRVEATHRLEQERALRHLVSRYERVIWPLLLGVKIMSGVAILNLPPVSGGWWTATATSSMTLGVSAYIGKPYASHIWSSIMVPWLSRLRDRWHPAGGSKYESAETSNSV